MAVDRFRLRPPLPRDEAALRSAAVDLAEEGHDLAPGLDRHQPFEVFVARTGAHRRGLDLLPGWVPSSLLVAEADGELVGTASIRYELNGFLAHEGGHIGYAVVPERRRRGHATEILGRALVVAEAVGIDRALVTCDEGNVGSATVIERAGGVLADRVRSVTGTTKRRYWIEPPPGALHLRPPRDDDDDQVRAAHAAMADDGFVFALGLDGALSFPAWVAGTRAQPAGIDLPPDLVPATFLLAVVDDEVVGRVSIRHALNALLAAEGGHIGYGVLAAHRGRGHATEILRRALVVARAVGIDRALLFCDDDNLASAAVIEGRGGVLDGRPTAADGTTIRRYWID